jgi:hypothetical protein
MWLAQYERLTTGSDGRIPSGCRNVSNRPRPIYMTPRAASGGPVASAFVLLTHRGSSRGNALLPAERRRTALLSPTRSPAWARLENGCVRRRGALEVVDGMAKRSFLGAAASWDRVVQQTLVPASAAKHVRGTAAHDAGVADDATGCASGDVQVRALAGRRDLPSLLRGSSGQTRSVGSLPQAVREAHRPPGEELEVLGQRYRRPHAVGRTTSGYSRTSSPTRALSEGRCT